MKNLLRQKVIIKVDGLTDIRKKCIKDTPYRERMSEGERSILWPFPKLLTIVNNICLYRVYNKDAASVVYTFGLMYI